MEAPYHKPLILKNIEYKFKNFTYFCLTNAHEYNIIDIEHLFDISLR